MSKRVGKTKWGHHNTGLGDDPFDITRAQAIKEKKDELDSIKNRNFLQIKTTMR